MTPAATLIAAFERRLSEEDHSLRSGASHWVKSGAVVAPPTVLHALDALHAATLHFQQLAEQLKPHGVGDTRAKHLLSESLSKWALGLDTLRVAASATSPDAQTSGFRKADALIKSAAKLFAKARTAAG